MSLFSFFLSFFFFLFPDYELLYHNSAASIRSFSNWVMSELLFSYLSVESSAVFQRNSLPAMATKSSDPCSETRQFKVFIIYYPFLLIIEFWRWRINTQQPILLKTGSKGLLYRHYVHPWGPLCSPEEPFLQVFVTLPSVLFWVSCTLYQAINVLKGKGGRQKVGCGRKGGNENML